MIVTCACLCLLFSMLCFILRCYCFLPHSTALYSAFRLLILSYWCCYFTFLILVFGNIVCHTLHVFAQTNELNDNPYLFDCNESHKASTTISNISKLNKCKRQVNIRVVEGRETDILHRHTDIHHPVPWWMNKRASERANKWKLQA